MQIVDVDPRTLKPANYNPRVMSSHDGEALQRSLTSFGFVENVVVNKRSGNIVSGHMRVRAAIDAGLDTVPVNYIDVDDVTERQINLTMNRTRGDWQEEQLAEVLAWLATQDADLTLTGFQDAEISKLLDSVMGPEAPTDDADLRPPVDPVTKPGDLWLLGKHRLLCGDSANTVDVARLMGGRKAGLLWTDPPYGVSYVGKTQDALTLVNDSETALPSLLHAAFANAINALEAGSPFYVAHPAGALQLCFLEAAHAAGWQVHEQLVWVKDSMVLGHSDYHYKHEPILYGWMPGPGRSGRGDHKGSRWYGDHSQTTVLTFDRPKRSEEHPTMKPPELVAYCMTNSSKRGDIVLDLFGGSGSTLIAAETLARAAYIMEIDPTYCDVIVRRWEALTGKTATLEP